MLQQSTLSVSAHQATSARNSESDLLQQRANNTNRTSSSNPRRPKTGNDNVVRAMSPEGRRYLKPVNGIQTKGFARSAQRRSSVLTLGSIERLQHFYAKRDLKVNKVGILGFKNEMARALKEEQEEDDDDDILPERQEPPPSWMNLDVETDLDVLLQQCFEDTQVMLHNWGMVSEHSDSDASSDNEGGFHIGSLLQSVTRTLDSVRNYTFHRNSLTETAVKKLRVAGIQLLGVMKEMELRHQKGEGDDEGFIPYSKLQNERAAIIEYLSIVEDYAFNPPHHIGCPPVTFGPQVSALFNKDSSLKRRVDTPSWLDADCFVNDDIGRYHALLCDNLPGESLPDPHMDEEAFLNSLADGRILCNVYNSIVNRSRRPFGLITKIHHDTNRTFRATENLRFFAAACKFRFDLALRPFDPMEVARKTERGLVMLELAVSTFCSCAINELRESAHPTVSKKRALPTSPSVVEHVENTFFTTQNNDYRFP